LNVDRGSLLLTSEGSEFQYVDTPVLGLSQSPVRLELCADELVVGGGVRWSYDRRRRRAENFFIGGGGGVALWPATAGSLM